MTWLSVRRRLALNAQGFFIKYRLFVGIFLLGLLADAISTIFFMLEWQIGPGGEIHPVVRWATMLAGPVAGPLFGAAFKAVAGLLVAIYLRHSARVILLSAGTVGLWAAWYHLWGYMLYEPLVLSLMP